MTLCAQCKQKPAVFEYDGHGFCSASCKYSFMEKLLYEPDEKPTEVFQITAEALQRKQYLVDLAGACEELVGAEKAKQTVKLMGAEIVRLITTQFGDSSNLEAIATVTRVLIYILDETEKRSMQSMALRALPPAGGLLQ